MTIRHARPSDLPALVEILNAAIAQRQNALLAPVSAGDRAGWLDAHPPEAYPLWVASGAMPSGELAEGETREVAGWCSLSPWRSGRGALAATAEISVYIAPGRQRQGVGTALLRHAIRHAPEVGIRTLLAIGLETNAASLALFTCEGFARWGALPDVAQFGSERVGQWILGRSVAP
ncbi:GNAT family N-acetyltransferase [Rubricoccus marinus]|uniref:N-acetyltransferase domain-containing protein n=1 Tax=Rubricoccus marinus TaxID=716817 RepID=A0A259TWM9_9BACT|nr:GNAT family N-acetyltransferase [Rubricoccus marinus]OZC01984.1 hypothetical protein BSZ36_02700 [Rubricoccus marinus]